MGSLTSSGLPIIQATNTLRHSHNGNFVRQSDTSTDEESIAISNTGLIDLNNLGEPFGVEHRPSQSRTLISGQPLSQRELVYNASATGILLSEFNKFTNDSGNLRHVVTRAMGIHTSVTDRESPNSALGPMVARTERKIFFIDDDSGKSSGLSDWEIFDGSGCPVGTQSGITDTDVSPTPTFDEPC